VAQAASPVFPILLAVPIPLSSQFLQQAGAQAVLEVPGQVPREDLVVEVVTTEVLVALEPLIRATAVVPV
jgi:hypothetical protein